MDEKTFIILNGLLLALVLVVFLRSRKKDGPSRLKLDSKVKIQESNFRSRGAQRFDEAQQKERSINVIFQYNGHSWEAFEVLGLPAGSSKGDAEKAYDKLIKTAARDEIKFFKAALDAIRAS